MRPSLPSPVASLVPLVAGAALAATLLVSASAKATPNFPPGIESQLGLSYEPPCSICHLNGRTGTGTVTTPFGLAMKQRGLQPFDEATLEAALAKMEADKVDSDGNGVTDVDQLRQGKSPNDANVVLADVDGGADGGGGAIPGPYRTGCGAQVAPAGPSGAGAPAGALLGLTLAALAIARRRPRR